MDSKNMRHTFETFFFSNPAKGHCVLWLMIDSGSGPSVVYGQPFHSNKSANQILLEPKDTPEMMTMIMMMILGYLLNLHFISMKTSFVMVDLVLKDKKIMISM